MKKNEVNQAEAQAAAADRDREPNPFWQMMRTAMLESAERMLAGVCVGAEAMVVVALGITRTGEKVVLDFEVGASENRAVANALVARLVARGFGPLAGHRQLAVLAAWPDTLIQRCVIHEERNLFGCLRKSDHTECRSLWRRLRLAQGADAGREALARRASRSSPCTCWTCPRR